MKRILLFAALCIIMAVGSTARERIYNVGAFDRLSILGDINVVYSSNPDSLGIARYDSDIDFNDAIEITNNKGKLSIKEVRNHNLGKIPTIYIYSSFLTDIRNEGNATVEATHDVTIPTLSANLVGNGKIICNDINVTEMNASITTGNGTIVLRGNCNKANYKIAGAGVIQADELETPLVKCSVLGTGTIGCWANEQLDVRGVGTTKIYYRGNPTVKKVGGAKIYQIVDSPYNDNSNKDSLDDEPTIVSE